MRQPQDDVVGATFGPFIAGPDGGDPSAEDFMVVTPDLVEFIATHYQETLPGPAREALGLTEPGQVFDTVVEGRRSYDIGLAAGIDDAYPHLRHLVVSTTLGSAPAAAVEVISDDPLARVRELKAEDGLGIWLVGGGRLAHALLPEIDRLVIKLNPSVVGSGVPLFDGGFAPTLFETVAVVGLASGVQVITCERRA